MDDTDGLRKALQESEKCRTRESEGLRHESEVKITQAVAEARSRAMAEGEIVSSGLRQGHDKVQAHAEFLRAELTEAKKVATTAAGDLVSLKALLKQEKQVR